MSASPVPPNNLKQQPAIALATAISLTLTACSEADDTPSGTIETPQTQPADTEKCPTTWQPLIPGPEGEGTETTDPQTQIKARLDQATPNTPNKDLNTWRIAIQTQDNQPATSATIGWACAWMSVHGHGTNPKAIEKLDPGVFELSSINFTMYGPWSVRLWVDPTGQWPQYLPQNGTALADGTPCQPTNGVPSNYNIEFEFCVTDDLSIESP